MINVSRQLNSIRFKSGDWNKLKDQSDKTIAKGHRPQNKDPEANKKCSVDVINLAEKTQKPLMREGQPVFFHCNTVKSGNHSFDCHQLPNDYSRDDIWLSLWNDAGEAGGKATIMKLSTKSCPQRNDLPTIRDYWPVSKNDPSASEFIQRCSFAEKVLENAPGSRRARSLHVDIQKAEASLAQRKEEIASIQAELSELKQTQDGAASSSGQTDNASLIQEKEDRLGELNKFTAKLEKELSDRKEELSVFLKAAEDHLAFVREQKANAEAGGTGAFVDELTTEDGIKVELKEEEKLEGFPGAIIRRFKLTKEGEAEPRTVTQIDYPNWEDFSASGSATLASLRDVYQREHGDNPSPLKVHCRAGVGRTGTFIAFAGAMDIIEDAVREGKIQEMDCKQMIFDLISDIRSQRDWQMIQTKDQGAQLILALQSEVLKLAQEVA